VSESRGSCEFMQELQAHVECKLSITQLYLTAIVTDERMAGDRSDPITYKRQEWCTLLCTHNRQTPAPKAQWRGVPASGIGVDIHASVPTESSASASASAISAAAKASTRPTP
jgi:hypothetical protein